MFIFEWLTSKAMEEIFDWFYAKILEALSEFFTSMNGMGAEIFDLLWVQAITTFFSNFAWVLFVTGLVVAVFDCALDVQNGRMTIRDTAINILKGFMACGMLTLVPINLYKFTISMQNIFSHDMIGLFETTEVEPFKLANLVINGDMFKQSGFMQLCLMICIGYCVIKVFFANIKRGGILIISIALGSLYMFSVPRGYTDGFISWCKQVAGLCFTAFMQVTLLMAGLITWNVHPLLAVGIMLAASEVPRIAGQFGLDTSTRGNLMSGVYAAQSAVNLTRSIVNVVRK